MKRNIGDRSRIEGPLHRVCQLAVSVRQLDDGATDDGLLRLRLSASSEYAYTRSSWWDDPWVEVLGHKPDEVDLSRLNSGGALLGNHDRYSAIGNTPLASIGAVERAWIENGRVMADVVISRREALADLRQDILDGIVSQVSIGYSINERVLTRAGKDSPDEYRVTSWTPFEISLVDVPADPTIGIGRDASELRPNDATARPGYRVVELSRSADPAGGQAGNTTQERTMPQANDVAVESNAANTTQTDPLAAERERVRELTALGRQFDCRDDADAAVNAGTTIEAFRTQLLSKLKPAARVTPAEGDSDIGMSGRDLQRFSFARAFLYAMDPTNAGLRNAAAFELECSNAARDKRTDETRKEREGGITVPADVLRHAFAVDSASAEIATRMLIARAQQSAAYRDLVVGTATAGGNLVATDLLAGSFIELLRAKSRLIEMGATTLTGLSGNIAIPRQTGGAAFYWVGENGAPTESQASFDQVAMTPKTIGLFTDYSRRLMMQSSIAIEAFVRTDLAVGLTIGLDYTGLNGSGSGNEPTGLFNMSGIGAVVGGTNGAAPTWDMVVQMEEAVAVANADVGALAYLTNPKVRSKLKRTQKFSGTNGQEIWLPGRDSRRGIGEVNGYDAYATNNVPSNLTKGTSSGICSAAAFGNWTDFLIAMWGGLDIMLDPYSQSTTGARRVVALMDADLNVRRGGSFAVVKDLLTA